MKRNLIRLSICLLLVLLLLSAVTVSATTDPEPEFTFRADAMVLYHYQQQYHYYFLPHNVVCSPRSLFLLSEEYYTVESLDLDVGYLYSTQEDGGSMIWGGYKTNRYINGIYVDADEIPQLDRWLDGKGTIWRLKHATYEQWASMPNDPVKELDKLNASAKLFDVRDLEETERYDIYAFDATDVWGYVYGAVYILDDGYYYLNYSKLGNEHFDSDGNFSYRSGDVFLMRLTEAQEELIDRVSAKLDYVTYEQQENDSDGETGEMPIAVFWIVYLMLGVIIPVPLIFLGILLPSSRKLGYPKYWYTFAVIAGIWLLVAMALGVLLVLL